MLESLGKTIKTCDFLSPSVELYLEGNSRIKTKIGVLLCLCLLLLALIGFFFFFSKVLDYSGYTVSMNKIYERYHHYSLNTSETVIDFKLMDRLAGDFTDNTYTA